MSTGPESPLADPQQIQGNILRPFGGQCQAFLFLSFRNDRAAARRWLAAAAGRVAGTDDVGAARDGSRIAAGESLLNVGLTATGLVTLHPEVAGDLVGFEAFWKGPLGPRLDDTGRLTTAPALLGDVGDSDPESWLIGGPGRAPVDALLTIAAEDETTLEQRVDQERAAAHGVAILPLVGAKGELPEQWGQILRRPDGQRIEHFGFADGISQPGVLGFTSDARPGSPLIAAGEFILGCAGERRPQTWTPRPTPAPWMRGGSFQVFRRLRQDVAGWWDRMGRLSDEAGAAPEDLAAAALGRRLDGTPLAPAPHGDDNNDFTYRDDEHGAHTPLFAHIRKMNPRHDDVFRDRGHKMLRRGIPFGPPFERDNLGDSERGLIFNAYMASIEDQFEHLQRRWANDPEFPTSTLAKFGLASRTGRGPDGLDPVIGDDAGTARRRLGEKVAGAIPPAAFGGFVTTTGTVYAFAPSLGALRVLSGDRPLDAGPAFGG
jgi:Dyp-type peroxidase family